MAGDYTPDYATNVISSVYPNARITSGLRSAEDPLSKANPNSYHAKGLATDIAPIPGMNFDDYVQGLKDNGARVLEARNEVTDPVPYSTGPHWHVAIAPGYKLPQANPQEGVVQQAPVPAQDNIGTPQGPVNRDIFQQISDAYHRTANTSFAGWGSQELFQHFPHLMSRITGSPDLSGLTSDQRDAVLSQARKQIEQRYANLDMKDPSNIGVQLAGGLGGADPSWAFGGVGIGKGASALASRVASIGAVGALDNAAVQGLNMAKGLQKDFSTFESLGAGLGAGGMHLLGAAAGRVAPFFKQMIGDETSGRPVSADVNAEPAANPAFGPKEQADVQARLKAGEDPADIVASYKGTGWNPSIHDLEWYRQNYASGKFTGDINWKGPENAQVGSDAAGVGAGPNEGQSAPVAEGQGGNPQTSESPQAAVPQAGVEPVQPGLMDSTSLGGTEPPSLPPSPQPVADNANTLSPAVDEKMAGSINKDRISDDPSLRAAYDEWAKAQDAQNPQTFEDTANLAKDYLNRGEEELFKGPDNISDLHGWQHAIRIQANALIKDMMVAGNDASEDLVNRTRAMVGLNTETASSLGRALSSRRITLEEGAKTGDFGNDVTSTDVKAVLDKVSDDPEAAANALGLSTSPKADSFWKKAWFSTILSNPMTHFRYYSGMLANFGLEFGSDLAASGLGQLGRFSGEDASRVYGTEMAARAAGTVDGLVTALKSRLSVPQVGEAMPEAGAGSSLADKSIFLPLTALHATEGFFNDVFKTSYLWGEAGRVAREQGTPISDLWSTMSDLRQNPTADMLKNVSDNTNRILYKDEPSAIGKMLEGARNALPEGAAKGASYVLMPFTARPDAVMRAGIRWSGPLGLLDRYNQAGLMQNVGRESDRAIARLGMGTAIAGLFAGMAGEGLVTGIGPSNFQKNQELQASGWMPNSVKVGDTYHSIKGLSPLYEVASTMADLVDKFKNDGDYPSYEKASLAAAHTIAGSVLENTSLHDFSPVMAALDQKGGERTWQNYIAGLPANMVVPAGVRAINQAYIDPVKRDVSADDISGQMLNRIKSGVPGLSQTLPEKLNVWGFPQEQHVGFLPTSQDDQDPIIQETQRLANGAKGALITPPNNSMKIGPSEIVLNPEQHRQATIEHGQIMHQALSNLYNEPGWQFLSDDTKREVIGKVRPLADKVAKLRALKGGQ